MRYKVFGRHTGLRVSELVLGAGSAWTDGLKPLHALTFADTTVTAYFGLIALVANVVTAVLVNFAMTSRKQTPG